jgi:hypothetical protein
MLLNIERSTFRPGEHVGYANGAWRIRRSNGRRGPWLAIHASDASIPPIYAPTLAAVSARLAKYDCH